jgi:carbamoyl-phosphate synthase large subunit
VTSWQKSECKRLSLLERFSIAGQSEKVDLRLMAVEDTPYAPISVVSEIVLGPRFKTADFGAFLLELVEREGIDVVIPNMDAATVALAELSCDVRALGCRAVSSELELCRSMEDKARADEWFRERRLPVPSGNGFPRVIKRRLGFGSRGQAVVADESELSGFFLGHTRSDYFVQALIDGQEYTVDAYVAGSGDVLGIFSRKRLAISDGEVDISEAHRHDEILALSRRILEEPGWEGPVTLQFFDAATGPVLIEVNPRFGGGVTHAIQFGLDMPRWIIREVLGRPVEAFDAWDNGSIMTRCRRDIFL